MTTMRRQAGPLGAALRFAPDPEATVFAHVPAGTILAGLLIYGEAVFGEDRYIQLPPLFVWIGRTLEETPDLPRARLRRAIR